MTTITTPEEKEEVFTFLDSLREWGGVNMFGAGLYVQEAFEVNRREAQNLVSEWMRTFSERHPEPAQ